MKSDQTGYLIVEYIVSLGLIIVIILALFSMLNAACTASESARIETDIIYSCRSAMLMIRDDVVKADKMQVVDNGDRLRLQNGTGFVSYYVSNHQLYRHGTVKLPVAENTESVLFRTVKPGLVEVLIQASSAGRSCTVQGAFSIKSGQ